MNNNKLNKSGGRNFTKLKILKKKSNLMLIEEEEYKKISFYKKFVDKITDKVFLKKFIVFYFKEKIESSLRLYDNFCNNIYLRFAVGFGVTVDYFIFPYIPPLFIIAGAIGILDIIIEDFIKIFKNAIEKKYPFSKKNPSDGRK